MGYVKTLLHNILYGKCWKTKEALDKDNSFSAIFMDLSKAFDTLNHDLLVVKLEAYGFSAKSFSYIHSDLNKRLQKTNVNCDFSL